MKNLKLNALIIAVFLCANCSENNPATTYHGSINQNNLSKIVKLESAHFKTFDELVDRIEQVSCNDSIPTLSIKVDKEEWLLGLANPCWEGVTCILTKRRNVLKIKDEKIKMTNEITLDSLKPIMTRHYNNYGESFQFSESPTKAKISVTYEQNKMNNLISMLKNVLDIYSSLNLELPIIVSLDKEIPPPPPKPIEYELRK